MDPKLNVGELLLAILGGKFHKGSDSMMEGFAGCEGQGWIWSYHNGCVVIDLMGDHMVAQVFEEDLIWHFNSEDRCFEQIN